MLSILCINFDAKISLGEVITIGAAIIALYYTVKQFKTQMEESRSAANKLQKENWYLNIIVLPQLGVINENYFDLIELIQNKIGHIKDISSSTNVTDFREQTGKIKKEIKDTINKDFDNIITLVRSYDFALSSEVNTVIMDLTDICTIAIDRYSDELNMRKQILENKQKLISILNKGLKA